MPRRPDRPPLFPDCTGALVAGGQASRLGGVAKGLLQLDGEPIVARSLTLFRQLFPASIIVANDAPPYSSFGAPVVKDVIAGKGAPSGLHSALTAARTEWVFMAACDMPFLAAGPIAWLAEQRVGTRAAAVFWHGRLETLHAFWSRSCLPLVDRMLREGEPSMWTIATAVGARFVPEEEWRRVDPLGRVFANANTAEEAESLGLTLPPGA
jgi:molybdopterin-guanine dinucleotide biosynthesis protein A